MRVVCAVDGSRYSQWAVGSLEALAGREPDHVTLVHVVNPAALALTRRNPVTEKQALAAMEKAGVRLLRDAVRAAKAVLGQAVTGPSTTFHSVLARGPLARTIAQQARRAKADLLVVGSRGLSDIQGYLLGSVSRQVASIASCPVLVVRQPLSKLTAVTLAVDDTRHSRAAARFLRTRVLPEHATVTILTSAESPVTDLAERYLSASQLAALKQPAISHATDLVNQTRNEFIKDGYSVVTQVKMDHVVDTIVKQLEADKADLLVVGSRNLTKSERLHLGTVSESLLKYAPCSVMIVRGARV